MPELATSDDLKRLTADLTVRLGGIIVGCMVLMTAVLGLLVVLT